VQHTGITQILAQLTKQVLLPCRVVAVTTMAISFSLENTVFGGVLRSTMVQAHGPVACTTIAAKWTGATTIRS
ncbi:MAG TPA: hypothetical protein PLS84_07400, partial [Salinivirgaceae bacterium]|nr:hypothetical protein [Salinivirgaceae bacterium]